MDSASDDEEFDANSVLWDSDNDEEEDEVDECDRSVGTVRSIRSVAIRSVAFYDRWHSRWYRKVVVNSIFIIREDCTE